MPINKPHSEYERLTPIWLRCRDAFNGDDSIKGSKQVKTYVPELDSHKNKPEAYDAYIGRGVWYGASARARDGLKGAILRKPTLLSEAIENNMEDLLSNIDAQGTAFETYKNRLIDEILEVGRFGILVEIPEGDQLQVDPYFVLYEAEKVIFTRYEVINGLKTLVEVRLKEEHQEQDPEDPYNWISVEKIRRLSLFEINSDSGNALVYNVEIYGKDKDGKWLLESDNVPLIQGSPLNYIPFVIDEEYKTPPLLDLVNENINHFRVRCDYAHGLHYTGLPTPVICDRGAGQDRKFYIGSKAAWKLSEHGKAFFLEFHGTGLKQAREELEDSKKQMAVLGARLLENQRAGVEAAETARIRQSGESSVLAGIVDDLDAMLTQAFQIAADWRGYENLEDFTVQINRDFIDTTMDAQEALQLGTMSQSGLLPLRALHFNLMRGERLPDDMDFEMYQGELDIQGPGFVVGGGE